MTQAPASSTNALITTDPENCLDCFRLIRPGETYYPGEDDTVLCPNCVSDLLVGEDFDTIKATDQVAVDWGGLIRVRREGAAIIVAPDEVRHLVDALVEAAVRAVVEQVGERNLVWNWEGISFGSQDLGVNSQGLAQSTDTGSNLTGLTGQPSLSSMPVLDHGQCCVGQPDQLL